MTRRNFTRSTKLAAWERSSGRCEGADCGRKLFPGDGVEYDHIIADEHGGGNGLDNCQVLCCWCHKPKTRADMKVTVRSRKARAAWAGADKPRHIMPGSKRSIWKRTVDGRTVLR